MQSMVEIITPLGVDAVTADLGRARRARRGHARAGRRVVLGAVVRCGKACGRGTTASQAESSNESRWESNTWSISCCCAIRLSPRTAGPFIVLNAAAIPDTLLEAEIFGQDIPLLAAYFLHTYAQENHKDSVAIQHEALQRLLAHPWPGNVRELANVMSRP
jgi:hypothetical protein